MLPAGASVEATTGEAGVTAAAPLPLPLPSELASAWAVPAGGEVSVVELLLEALELHIGQGVRMRLESVAEYWGSADGTESVLQRERSPGRCC